MKVDATGNKFPKTIFFEANIPIFLTSVQTNLKNIPYLVQWLSCEKFRELRKIYAGKGCSREFITCKLGFPLADL